jgi:hypothetical protein
MVPFGVAIMAVAVLPAAAGAGADVGQPDPAPPAGPDAPAPPELAPALGFAVALVEHATRSAARRALATP